VIHCDLQSRKGALRAPFFIVLSDENPCMKINLSLSLVLSLAAIPAQAQDHTGNGSPLDELVVTSSRIPLPLRQIGTSISVLTTEDLQAYGNLSMTDVLRQLPAVAVSNYGGTGQTTSLRIRGEEGFRTLTIMDGLRLSDPSAPQVGPILEHLLSSGINRVEILRGPQGLAYGADAGGVLNVSSDSGSEGLQAVVDAQSGRFGTNQLSANVGGGNARADFFVSASTFETDGFNALAADNISADKDGYENNTVHLRGGVNLNDAWRVDLVHRHVDSETLHDNCFSPTLNGHDCLAEYQLDATRLALNYEGANFTHSLSWNRTDTTRDNFSSGNFSFGAKGELERWEYMGSATKLPGFKLAFGADLEDARNNGVGRDNVGVFVEYLSDFSDTLYLTAGLRHDDNDDFGTNTSYRSSAAWLVDLPDDTVLKFKGSLGTGFRAPSPYEIQYNSGPWASPPASLVSLQQETSRGWEGGVEYVRGRQLRLEAVYFKQKVEDAIDFDAVAWSGYLQDLGTSSSKGIELSGDWSLTENWRLRANYTWNDTERPNGEQRLRRPRHLFNAGLSWFSSDARFNLNAFLRASRDSIDLAFGDPTDMADFEVLDLSANFSLTRNLQLYGRLENALDKDHQQVAGYHAAGRAAYVGFRWSYSTL
jgi:vitamin B12 transporter